MSDALLLDPTKVPITVAFLHRKEPQLLLVEGIQKEVWLKGPGDLAPSQSYLTHFGTGFFVAHSDRAFLVTAAHVAKLLGTAFRITLLVPPDSPATYSVAQLVLPNTRPTWYSSAEADVAVLEITTQDPALHAVLRGRFLPSSFLEPALAAPPRSAPLTVLGFPRALGTEGHFSPLSQQTFTSSALLTLPLETGRATCFVLQAPSISGYSGAPVFDFGVYSIGAMTTTGEAGRCYGLMHGTYSDDTGGKLGVVVPSHFIIRALNSALAANPASH